ncbi:hypothetical protein VIBRN418_14836 [Vibrio sp. N418]|uniref:hypothetical protein n=1 Tax=Vibrio sp. (strain N418) TaxID=701176 RepID=UPI00021C0A7A|nr:hypothetical protein [Vibrio sp. N418]EGU29507.1 hypothetical protein VIBRN418_14836 [Vibrio sp. N418]
MKLIIASLFILTLSGCKTSSSESAPSTPTDTSELTQTLKEQPTIDDQFKVLYDRFKHTLDRSDSLTGPDEDNNGIRDDIENFINLLQVTDPVRNAIKQNARQFQINLYHDWSDDSDENVVKAWRMSDGFLKVIACQDFVGIDIDDSINIAKTLTALTYNTKARTMNFIAYNHLQDGSSSVLLPAEAQYCE